MTIIASVLSLIGIAMLALSFTKVVIKTSVKKNITTAISLNPDGLVNKSPVSTTAAGKWKMINRQGYKMKFEPAITQNLREAGYYSAAEKPSELLIAGNSNGYKAASVTYLVTSAPMRYNAGKDLKEYSVDQPILLADVPVASETPLALATGVGTPVYALN